MKQVTPYLGVVIAVAHRGSVNRLPEILAEELAELTPEGAKFSVGFDSDASVGLADEVVEVLLDVGLAVQELVEDLAHVARRRPGMAKGSGALPHVAQTPDHVRFLCGRMTLRPEWMCHLNLWKMSVITDASI